MRKIIVLSMITLDGVIQGPGGREEDTENEFSYGGWSAPFTDEIYQQTVRNELQPAEYLLGRKTFEIWENYWPHHGEFWPAINTNAKYVLSGSRTSSDWNNSHFIKNIDDIRNLKNTDGADIHIWGSSEVVHLLLEHELADVLRLKIHPIILGKGKRLFNDKATPAAFTLTEHKVTTTGVILATYTRAGDVQTKDVTG